LNWQNIRHSYGILIDAQGKEMIVGDSGHASEELDILHNSKTIFGTGVPTSPEARASSLIELG